MDGVLVYPISGVNRKFICKTYALGKVLKHLGITVTELLEGGYFSEDSNAGDFTDTVLLFMYHSAVFAAEMDGLPVDFKPTSCYDWIDQDGGFSGGLYTQFSTIALKNLGFKEVPEKEEALKQKKSPVKKSSGKKS